MEKTALGVLRIALGFVFLWAFFDKLLGLGFSTLLEKSWLAGASPTLGFLKSASGTFASIFNMLAGNILVDWLFMAGLAGIGIALVLGIGMRAATYSGTLLLLLMYLAVYPPKTNPVLDDHIIYIVVLWVLYFTHAGRVLGLGKAWDKSGLVKQFPILQ